MDISASDFSEVSFRGNNISAMRDYFDENGYVVVRGLLTPSACDAVRGTFDREVRQSRVPILRQKNMQYERNQMSQDGYLTNPIFNVQDLDRRRHGAFRAAALDVLTAPDVARTIEGLLSAPGAKLIQSMFFEAPAGTWAHQDSYYQDSAARLGGCVAGWFALEDIAEDAGRFYVCPASHRRMALIRNEGPLNFALGHDAYKVAVQNAIAAHGLTLHAPALRKGDVLFWNSMTVHGSFPTGRRGASRASLTGHYLAADDEMLQFHTRIRRQSLTEHNAMPVGLLHDQSRRRNRAVRVIAYRFPTGYRLARRAAIAALLKFKRTAAA